MAADARISTALSAHPKTKKLKKRLGAAGCWSFVCLLLWAADNKHDGNLIGMSDEEIELAAEWDGEDGALVRALVEVRFLDGIPQEYRVHDWVEHQPWASARGQRIEAARKAANARWRPERNAESMRSAFGEHANRLPMRTAPNPTGPNPTQNPNQEEASCSEVNPPTSEPSVISLPCVGRGSKVYDVTQQQVDAWQEDFPGIDISAELRHARAWLQANRKRQKTHGGMPRFLVGWFGKEQNRARPAHEVRKGTRPAQQHGSFEKIDYTAELTPNPDGTFAF